MLFPSIVSSILIHPPRGSCGFTPLALTGDDLTWESCLSRTLYALNTQLLIIEVSFTGIKVHDLLFHLLPKSIL